MIRPAWAAGDLDVRPVSEYDPDGGVLVRRGNAGASWLGPERSRSLAWWLLAVVGDRPAPSNPDAVRLAIDEARRALRERSASADTTEGFRAGLAWADHALGEIAAAAGVPTERTTR